MERGVQDLSEGRGRGPGGGRCVACRPTDGVGPGARVVRPILVAARVKGDAADELASAG